MFRFLLVGGRRGDIFNEGKVKEIISTGIQHTVHMHTYRFLALSSSPTEPICTQILKNYLPNRSSVPNLTHSDAHTAP